MLNMERTMSVAPETDGEPKYLEDMLTDPQSPLYLHSLIDFFIAIVQDAKCGRTNEMDIESLLNRYEVGMDNAMEIQMKWSDFILIKQIGEEMSGNVYLVRHVESSKLFAMKIIKKSSIDYFSNYRHMNERNALVLSSSPWLLQLQCAFQDRGYLYLVTDYVPGGNLEDHLSKVKLSEEEVKFYAAELLLALEAFHSINYLHGDALLDKFILDVNGHVVLTDYTLCEKLDTNGQVRDPVTNVLYGKEHDWGSIAISISYMLQGEKDESCIKAANLPEQVRDLLYLLHEKGGSLTYDQIKQHPWFKNDQWTFDTIRSMKAPIVPKLENFDEDCPAMGIDYGDSIVSEPDCSAIPFIGYTYYKQNGLLISDAEHTPSMLAMKEEVQEEEETRRLRHTVIEVQEYISVLEKEKLQAVAGMSKAYSEVLQLEGELANLKKEMANMEQDRKELKAELAKERAAKMQHSKKDVEKIRDCGDKKDVDILKKKTPSPAQVSSVKEQEKLPRRQRHKSSSPKGVSQANDCQLDHPQTPSKKKEKKKPNDRVSQTNEDEQREEQVPEMFSGEKESDCFYYKAHDFVLRTYRFPRKCEHCIKPLWKLLKPQQALKCRTCHIRCHKHHMDEKMDISPCPVKNWVSRESAAKKLVSGPAGDMVQENQQNKRKKRRTTRKKLMLEAGDKALAASK